MRHCRGKRGQIGTDAGRTENHAGSVQSGKIPRAGDYRHAECPESRRIPGCRQFPGLPPVPHGQLCGRNTMCQQPFHQRSVGNAVAQHGDLAGFALCPLQNRTVLHRVPPSVPTSPYTFTL